MTRIAILHPTTLLGREVREMLEDRPHLASDLRLLSTETDEVGTLTGVGGGAAVILQATPAEVAGVDLLFLCGDPDESRGFLKALPPGATAIVLSPHAPTGTGTLVIPGVNPEAAVRGTVLQSPHPGAVLLAHLLRPLAGLGIVDVSATILQPASIYDHAGLDDLFYQTRGILAMRGGDSELFGRQLAFNVLPARTEGARLAAQAAQVLELEAPLSVQLLQGGVFHGMGVSLHLEISGADALEVHEALAESPLVEDAEEPELLGPIDAAAHPAILLGSVSQDRPGSIWIWAVMDNLTRGGALNAVEIAEGLLTGGN